MHDVSKREISYAEAILEGLDQAMEKDSSVIVIGEGVPDPKAIFGTTRGLREKHGFERVFDMPLAENGLTGICIGAALMGMRPVMVHQRIDFALLAMDQLVNNAAKWHYMFGEKAQVPLVVRMIIGRGWGQGPQHSQGLHAMFGQVPGLKVVMPTTPSDAKGMLLAAIADSNPVLFVEHRWLHSLVAHVPVEPISVPLDRARLLRIGDAVTVAAFSYMAMEALTAAQQLSAIIGVEVEVIDMRSVRPLDLHSVEASVRKTGRLLVADPAFYTGSIAGELIAQISERSFQHLLTAPRRVALPDMPAPTSHYMTCDYYPSPWSIAEAIIQMIPALPSVDQMEKLRSVLQNAGPHDVPHRQFIGPF